MYHPRFHTVDLARTFTLCVQGQVPARRDSYVAKKGQGTPFKSMHGHLPGSEAFSSEMSRRSPRKTFVITIKNSIYGIKASKKYTFDLILKKTSLLPGDRMKQLWIGSRTRWRTNSASFLAEISVRSPRKIFIFII